MSSDAAVQAIYEGMHNVTCLDHGPHCDTYAPQIRDAIRVGLQRAGLGGSTERPFPHGFARVQGRCLACRHSALFLGDGGYVTCGNPCAANELLEQQ